MWKQWKIIKPSPQKVVAVTCKRFQLQGFNWKSWCFGSVVAYGRWSFVRVGHTWRFDCTSMTKFLTSSQKQLLARQSWFLVLFSPPYITKSYSKLLIMLPVKENFNVVVLKSFFVQPFSFKQWDHHPSVYWSHKRCIECGFFCWQPSDCVGITRQDHQAVEYSRGLQVYHSGTSLNIKNAISSINLKSLKGPLNEFQISGALEKPLKRTISAESAWKLLEFCWGGKEYVLWLSNSKVNHKCENREQIIFGKMHLSLC